MPELEKSPWTAKLDWYLNFQICKASRHETKETPTPINSILEETGLPREKISTGTEGALMIASARLLPNKWVVVLPWNEDLSKWTQEIHKIWGNLNEPSLRVFLPPGQSASSLQLAWQKHQASEEFTVVLD
jgi:hypothetical protein